jgi:hypothetical protein
MFIAATIKPSHQAQLSAGAYRRQTVVEGRHDNHQSAASEGNRGHQRQDQQPFTELIGAYVKPFKGPQCAENPLHHGQNSNENRHGRSTLHGLTYQGMILLATTSLDGLPQLADTRCREYKLRAACSGFDY